MTSTIPSSKANQGFDLDATPVNSKDGDEVIYEVGGGATAVRSQKDPPTSVHDRLGLSEQSKLRGNQEFLAKNYLDAYDSYTEAIQACPGMTGEELLALKNIHDDAEREKAYARHSQETIRRRRIPDTIDETVNESSQKSKSDDPLDEESTKYTPIEFKAPAHEFAQQLAVYHSNRAACSLHLEHYDDAIKDCDIALLLNPKYTKALIRRMSAYESTQRTEEALRDAKSALSYEPNNIDIKKHVQRIQKMEDERLEKVKEETLGKVS